MNLLEYEQSGFKLYEEFTEFLADKIWQAIEESGNERKKKFRILTIKKRAKTPQSLMLKLKGRELENEEQIEEKIKDLAGCRLVFYYDDDVIDFLNSRLISNLFEVERDESKNFYPRRDPDSPNEQYTAIHYIIRLKPENCTAVEVKKFGALRAEIQIHTVLTDVWADSAHPITYKKRSLPEGFGAKHYERLEKRVEKVMTDFLRPAGMEFQKIWNDLEKLEAGKDLIDRGYLEKLGSDIDNNERFEILDEFKNYVLDEFDDTNEAFERCVEVIKTAFASSRNHKTIPIETIYGNMSGKSQKDVLEKCLEIIGYRAIWRVDFERVFSLLAEFYSQTQNFEERKAIEDFATSLAKYDLDTLKRVGVLVQLGLMKLITDWDDNTLLGLSGLARAVCKRVLNPAAEGVSASFKAVTISSGCIKGTDEVEKIREQAIKTLIRLYQLTEDSKERGALISALEEVSRRPHQGDPGEEFEKMMVANSLSVLKFFESRLGKEPLLILQKIRNLCHKLDWLINDRVVKDLALSIRDQIESDREFEILDTLVGYRSVFTPWSDKEFEEGTEWYRQEEERRLEKAKSFALEITPENFNEWKKRILKISKISTSDQTNFYLFRVFLSEASQASPTLFIKLLEKEADDVQGFIENIFKGLLISSEKIKARALIKKFIAEERFLSEAAWALRFEGPFDKGLAKEILNAASKTGEINPICHIIAGSVENWKEGPQDLVEMLFIPGVKLLSKMESSAWVDTPYLMRRNSEVFGELGEEVVNLILENLLLRKKIDYDAEQILKPFSQRFPEKVIQFFGKRLKTKPENPFSERYEACPFKFHELNKTLGNNPSLVTKVVRNWFGGQWDIYLYNGAYFLSRVYPDFPKEFQEELGTLLESGKEEDIDFVLSILETYDGQEFLNDLCKKIIKTVEEGSEKLKAVERVLEQTGVSTGEFGRVEKYEAKKTEIEEWAQDEDPKVRVFAGKYLQSLKNSIARETKWAVEDIEMQKHEWGYDEEA